MSQQSQGWSPEQVVPLLEKVELFEGLPEEDLHRIAILVDGRSLQAGESLFEEGEAGDAFYVVFSGSVEILQNQMDGTPKRLAIRRAGEAFGEMALLDDAPRSAAARAMEATRLMVLQRAAFQELVGGDSLALRLMRHLSKALRALDVRFATADRSAQAGPSEEDGAHAVSRLIQVGLLPSAAPKLAGYELAAGTTTEEAGRGGSVWDWIDLGDGRVALLTLDVRQEGFPPAYHLGVVRGVLRGVAPQASGVREILARTNDAVVAAGVEGLNQHVDVGLLIASADGLEWGSAGRVPGGIIRREGAFDTFGAPGPPLGMMEGFRYNAQSFEMGVGDTAFVLSHASQGLFMGAADLLAELHGKPAGEVVGMVHQAIRKAQGGNRNETSVLYVRKH